MSPYPWSVQRKSLCKYFVRHLTLTMYSLPVRAAVTKGIPSLITFKCFYYNYNDIEEINCFELVYFVHIYLLVANCSIFIVLSGVHVPFIPKYGSRIPKNLGVTTVVFLLKLVN